MSHRRPVAEHKWLETALQVAAITCDVCRLPADYELTARWPDGHLWQLDVCLLHRETSSQSLHDMRPEPADKPTITSVILTA